MQTPSQTLIQQQKEFEEAGAKEDLLSALEISHKELLLVLEEWAKETRKQIKYTDGREVLDDLLEFMKTRKKPKRKENIYDKEFIKIL